MVRGTFLEIRTVEMPTLAWVETRTVDPSECNQRARNEAWLTFSSDTKVSSGANRASYWGWHGDDEGGLNNLDAVNIASGNAGDGGDSSSGNAYGGNANDNPFYY
jgi:hypothetical protein